MSNPESDSWLPSSLTELYETVRERFFPSEEPWYPTTDEEKRAFIDQLLRAEDLPEDFAELLTTLTELTNKSVQRVLDPSSPAKWAFLIDEEKKTSLHILSEPQSTELWVGLTHKGRRLGSFYGAPDELNFVGLREFPKPPAPPKAKTPVAVSFRGGRRRVTYLEDLDC